MPSVKYLVIASDDRILLDAANKKFDSKYSATVSKLLAKVQTQQKDKHMINMQNHTFAFRLIHDLWYVCVSDAGFGKQMPFIFLQDVADNFVKKYPDLSKIDTVTLRGFQETMVEKIEQYSSPDDHDKVSKVESHLDELKNIVTENIDHAVKNSEDIEDLATKAEGMGATSSKFRLTSKNLQRQLCWNSLKMKFIAVVVFLIIIYLFAVSMCGFRLNHCSA